MRVLHIGQSVDYYLLGVQADQVDPADQQTHKQLVTQSMLHVIKTFSSIFYQ